MAQRYIYVVFSATPYLVGKAIRVLTGERYNHVSIALDAELTQMYGFARRFYRTPFYGGFVRESLSRYHVKGRSAQICICRVPVTQEQYEGVQQKLQEMLKQQDSYLYNHISILGTLIRRPIKARKAYTCVEFCVLILSTLGISVDPDKYYSLGALENLLEDHAVYLGPMPEGDSFDSDFYAEKPVAHPTLTTLRDFFRLIPRLGA